MRTANLHTSLDLYIHAKFIWNRRNLLWTDGRTYVHTDGHLRPALLGRRVDLINRPLYCNYVSVNHIMCCKVLLVKCKQTNNRRISKVTASGVYSILYLIIRRWVWPGAWLTAGGRRFCLCPTDQHKARNTSLLLVISLFLAAVAFIPTRFSWLFAQPTNATPPKIPFINPE